MMCVFRGGFRKKSRSMSVEATVQQAIEEARSGEVSPAACRALVKALEVRDFAVDLERLEKALGSPRTHDEQPVRGAPAAGLMSCAFRGRFNANNMKSKTP